MKKALTIGIVLVMSLFCIPSISHAERIKDFSDTITVNSDSSVSVTENIIYDFEGVSRHGIFRDIPVANSDGSYLNIDDINVRNGDLGSYNYVVTRDSGGVHIKIGDPNITVSGIKNYTISYVVHDALVSFPNYDELYWNVSGDQWKVPVDHVGALLNIPGGQSGVVQASCYRGDFGTNNPCSTSTVTVKKIDISESFFAPGEGLTLAAGFKKGLVSGIVRIGGQTNRQHPPVGTSASHESSGLVKLVVVLISILSLAGSVWYRVINRDTQSKDPVVAWYEPPAGLPPLALGTLVDKDMDIQDVTAQILSLANRGYVSLTRLEEKQLIVFTSVDYSFAVTKDPSDLGLDADRKLMEMMFSDPRPPVGTTMLMSELKGDPERMQIFIRELRGQVESFLNAGGYLDAMKHSKNTPAITALFFVVLYVSIRLNGTLGNFILILLPVLIVCLLLLSGARNRYTQLGADTRQKILGFKLFLSVTDKDRFAFHDAPEKNPTQFMEYLPYAIALGVDEKWTNQFEGMMLPAPSWYHSNAGNAFAAGIFLADMHTLNTSFSRAATVASSGSGGGGFSGGGGGGGGGGSW